MRVIGRAGKRPEITVNGKFVGKFGTEGKNLGEFTYPSALAALSTGRFVVVDACNDRIQIIE